MVFKEITSHLFYGAAPASAQGEGLAAVSASGAGIGPSLDACARSLAQALSPDRGRADLERIRAELVDIADMIRAGGEGGHRADYARFLRCLTGVYQHASARPDNSSPAHTASGYAAIVEAIHTVCPSLDYRPSVGQLLELMIRLFKARDSAWTLVYRHLRAISDALEAQQGQTRVCSADIREWIDAGAQNLFSLLQDLDQRVAELTREAEAVAREIDIQRRALEGMRRESAASGGKLVFLAYKEKQQEIAELRVKQEQILEQRDTSASTRELIRADIREFEERLRNARRAFVVYAV